MGKLEAHTTHTVKLSWALTDPLEKSELIRGLSDVLPDGAVITELTAGDRPIPQPEIAGPKAQRTLMITYLETRSSRATGGRDMATSRKPNKYTSITIAEDDPILPETVRKLLDGMPSFSDIVEMRVTTDDGPIPTRRVDIFYTTSMPWDVK